MPKKALREDRSGDRSPWKPNGDTITTSLISAAVRALDAYGGRPKIRRVRSDVSVDEMTFSMFGHLERADFPTLNELITTHVGPDPSSSLPDIRGIALQLLLDALSFKESLARYRSGQGREDLDALLWSLARAQMTHGELRASYSAAFEKSRLQWIQKPGQAEGRKARKRTYAERDKKIRQLARAYVAEHKKAGRRAPSQSQIARDVRKRIKLLDDIGQRLPSERRIRDIIRGAL